MRRNNSLSPWLLGAALALTASQASALKELSDDSLADVQGAGFAFALDNFSMRFAPESFIELTGATVNGVGWQRGDARYYGLSMTNGAQQSGTDWYSTLNGGAGGACAGSSTYGNLFLACPLGNGNSSSLGQTANDYGIGAMASVYDPYVLRVFEYPGHDYQGDYLTGGDRPTILELIGPSQTENWRWSFWGELEVDRVANGHSIDDCNNSDPGCTGGADFLQSQTIIHGKPTTTDGKPAILRLMQTANDADPTLGITYQSALSGDFRFSVRQKDSNPASYVADTLHNVPDFDDNEGLYFKNVDAFLPLGTLHYQAITLNAVRDGSGNATGDFVIELTRIPNTPEIYNHFYCGAINNANTNGCDTNSDGVLDSVNEDTRGYVRWGSWDIPVDGDINSATLPASDAVDNGIYFVGGVTPNGSGGCTTTGGCPANNITNIGISRIEGMRIHHMKITTLGANQ
ncbi:MAG: hypothetical protein MI745_14825 [Pseudomonadales bacterium]|nr:hypothetical protein [Pseudomonadales bacterium]